MFEKFQKSAKVAVVLSQEEAREMDESRIGAEWVSWTVSADRCRSCWAGTG